VGPSQWATLIGDRAVTGLGWALVGLDYGSGWAGLGRAGPAMWRAQALPRRVDGFKWAWVPVDMAHGGHDRAVHGSRVWFVMDSVHPLPSPHGARCTECTQQPPTHLPALWPHDRAPVHAIVGMAVMTRRSGALLYPSSRALSSFHHDKQLGPLFLVPTDLSQEE
jgi:hypothetical protein